MICGAELHIADDMGDNHATCRCQLEDGHELPHRHVFGRDDLDGNRTEVVVTFFCDERERCEICKSIASGDDEGFVRCYREPPSVLEALVRASATYEETAEARSCERWSCTFTDGDITVHREGATKENALRSAGYSLRHKLKMLLGVPCRRLLCSKCHAHHRCEDQETS